MRWPWGSAAGLGRACLLASAAGLIVGVLVVREVGTTLVPLIAHDRAGFGGAVYSCGGALLGCIWCGRPSRGLWCAIALVGMAGFGAAIGVHPVEGPPPTPCSTDLRRFHGDNLTQIALGPYDVQFRFGAGGIIPVWGQVGGTIV